MATPLQEITLITLIGAGNTETREGGERKTQMEMLMFQEVVGLHERLPPDGEFRGLA